METLEVTALPMCDFCPSQAKYDARTKKGPWAYMCAEHFAAHSLDRLGLGWGQELILVPSD